MHPMICEMKQITSQTYLKCFSKKFLKVYEKKDGKILLIIAVRVQSGKKETMYLNRIKCNKF